ncbi:Rrf2 family transcriptional regulator [Streptomyces lasalocidi]
MDGIGANSRLTVAVHTLTWSGLYQRRGHEVATSDQIATSVNTNPVVIRRLLAQQGRPGRLAKRRRHAGWTLSRDLSTITLLDVYEAVEPGPVFALHPATPDPECVVGHGVAPVLGVVYDGVETALRAELARTTLEDVLHDVLRAT